MRILITDRVHDLLIDGLGQIATVDYFPDMSYENVKNVVGNYQGLIVNSKIICDKPFLQKACHLLWIGRLGSGLDIFDLEHAKKLNIRIINSPEGNANAVGEHCLGMLLCLTNNIARANAELKKYAWNREANRGIELMGKRIGIIGLGHTGKAFASKLTGLNVHVVAYDKYLDQVPEELSFVQLTSLSALLSTSDVISIHLPLTDETINFANKSMFVACKRGVMIINTSRGLILSSTDLLAALRSEQISSAALDVIENEKPETWSRAEKKLYKSLIDHPKVIITPHIAGWTEQSLISIAKVLLEKIMTYHQLLK